MSSLALMPLLLLEVTLEGVMVSVMLMDSVKKKTACYIWTDHLLYCFETQQYVHMLSLYHSVQ